MYFDKFENLPNGEIYERSFSNPHPRLPDKPATSNGGNEFRVILLSLKTLVWILCALKLERPTAPYDGIEPKR